MMNDRLDKLTCYKTLPVWNITTIPEAFKNKHNTKSGTWAKLKILSGSLVMEFLSSDGHVEKSIEYSNNNQPGFIGPKQYHRIARGSDDLTCQLSFYHFEDDKEL